MTSPTAPGVDMAKLLQEILDRDMDGIFGNCTNTIDSPGSTLTVDTIMQSIERVRQIMDELPIRMPTIGGNSFNFGGIRIIESAAAVRRERVKTYPKRKAKSWSHWLRMDKKWLKRYGWREVPQMYMFQANRDMCITDAALIHPSQAVLLRNFKP